MLGHKKAEYETLEKKGVPILRAVKWARSSEEGRLVTTGVVGEIDMGLTCNDDVYSILTFAKATRVLPVPLDPVKFSHRPRIRRRRGWLLLSLGLRRAGGRGKCRGSEGERTHRRA
jgi:hypothetical protein